MLHIETLTSKIENKKKKVDYKLSFHIIYSNEKIFDYRNHLAYVVLVTLFILMVEFCIENTNKSKLFIGERTTVNK